MFGEFKCRCFVSPQLTHAPTIKDFSFSAFSRLVRWMTHSASNSKEQQDSVNEEVQTADARGETNRKAARPIRNARWGRRSTRRRSVDAEPPTPATTEP